MLEFATFRSNMRPKAGVAQLVEHLTCNEDVGGSTPLGGSSVTFFIAYFRCDG